MCRLYMKGMRKMGEVRVVLVAAAVVVAVAVAVAAVSIRLLLAAYELEELGVCCRRSRR